ncbi:hypothetical protein PS862_03098 [Pseudomonas fluorescens]|uniref:Uncharacterized protein n=1 Tax=Pseudomonas fluorescens TaxID=294 RepID=A0A5E6XH24_PSEFL|nr:hypothetical protein PS639_05301 [Pseudomonas fluorescens]VVP05963.1 hypothetical protein PS862_03098 [Pseudomonas fluorescens]
MPCHKGIAHLLFGVAHRSREQGDFIRESAYQGALAHRRLKQLDTQKMSHLERHAYFTAWLTFLEALYEATGNTGPVSQLLQGQPTLFSLELDRLPQNL